MSKEPIELKEILKFELKDIEAISKALDKVIMKTEKLKDLGVAIEGETLEELMILIKYNE